MCCSRRSHSLPSSSSSIAFCCTVGLWHPFSVSPSLYVLSCPFKCHSPFRCIFGSYLIYYGQDAAKWQIYSQARNLHFRPHRGDSLHRFMWNLAQPRRVWVRLAMQNFTSIGARVETRPPKWQKFPPFGKQSSRMGEPFDRFIQLLGAFYAQRTCISVLHLTQFT